MLNRRRVLIVSGGPARMSWAATLANHPEKFQVTPIEREQHVGRQAISAALDADRYGAEFFNYDVQCGSEIFAHTLRFFKMMTCEATKAK